MDKLLVFQQVANKPEEKVKKFQQQKNAKMNH